MRTIVLLTLVAFLAACSSANWKSINHPFDPDSGDSRLVDAKQRAIISVRRNLIGADGKSIMHKGKPITDLAVCVEPSPDALQATASALAGSLSTKSLENLLDLSASTSESAASIGLRTQTIQLLRDAYFRLCEAYLNDGIDAIAYDILQRRFQNQIIALLAVEQLTGAVAASQPALTTSAIADAGAKTGLVAQALKDAEDDLLKLQDDLDANASSLTELNEQKQKLDAQKAEIDKALPETTEQEKKAELEGKLAETENALAINAKQIQSTERRQKTLNEQIQRQNQQISVLSEAFGEAAKATIKSTTTGSAAFSGGSQSNATHTKEVANAVRAITLNAINQDYESQVCFESLRYRNHMAQYKSDVNNVFTSDGEKRDLKEGAFLTYCKSLFAKQAKLRWAKVGLVKAQADAITEIIRKIGAVEGGISADEATKLLLALAHAVPTEPGAAFLSREIETSVDGDATADTDNSKPEQLLAKINSLVDKQVSAIRAEVERLQVTKAEIQQASQQVTNNNTKLNDILSVIGATIDKKLQDLSEQTADFERRRAQGEKVKIGETSENIVLPIRIRTTAEIGSTNLEPLCKEDEVINEDATACVPKCTEDGTAFDPSTKECVKTGDQSEGKSDN